MYEENRRFSWTNLFIKIIIVVIFILFTIWLLKLTMKSATLGMSNSLDVLTDGIFSQNVEKMKEVGKSYFTTERLPKKVGETKKLSLARMYDEGLILELKDKNGNACSAKNSYVTIEKMETEYQMKVYLECGEEKDSVIVIMGCYNYCNTDICEKKDTTDIVPATNIEYQYVRKTGGAWGPYGNWTEWSTKSVTKTNSRDVDTKVVKENYSYDKTIYNDVYTNDAACPSATDGYKLSSISNGVCTYTKTVVGVTNPNECPSKNGDYVLSNQDGFTCNYIKSTKGTTNPEKCPSTSGDYKLVSQNGFTCNYSKSVSSTTNPEKCPSKNGEYTLVSQDGFTCNYSKTSTITKNATARTSGGDAIYGQSCSNVVVGTKTVWSCTSTCKQVIQNVTEYRCSSVVTGYTPVTTSYSCPEGYTRSGTTCSKQDTETTKTTVGCPSGYSKNNNICVTSIATTTTKTTTVGCPTGYSKSGNSCVANNATVSTKTTTVSCPNGYQVSGNSCVKDIEYTTKKNEICSTGETMKNGKCYRTESRIETITGVKDVTYYRYRTRTYNGGDVDYKWSLSNNDTNLLNAGYKLTGKTRNIGGK